VTLFRATILDTPGDPFAGDPADTLRVESDGGLLVRDGVIAARGSFSSLRAEHPDDSVVELSDGLLLPGFVDTHVHYPQMRAMGGLGMPLLDWLEKCALPEESKLAEPSYASGVAQEFLGELIRSGTTTALVFGSHFESAMDILFTVAQEIGLNVTTGLVLSDRILREDLLCSPADGLAASRRLIDRWHGKGRLRYAVTPRFSLSTSDEMLDVCRDLFGTASDIQATAADIWFTSHVNENLAEVATVADLFPGTAHYIDTYHRHGLVTDRSVFAHNVHPTDHELDLMGEAGAWTAHCPTSNSALGSGLFPLARHVRHGVGVALGSDVGAGTGLFLPKEGLQAYFMQQLLGADGLPLTPVHLLYLATHAGARALGLARRVGDLSAGKDFDAVWLRPDPSSSLGINLRHAADATDALARVFALSTPADVAGVWLRGEQAYIKQIDE
jgi:guanine deaminase